MFANHIVPALGKKRIDQIGPKEIELYKARAVKAGLKGKTINNQLSALRKALTVAAEWGLIDQPPRVQRAKTAPPPFYYLSFDEATRLVEAADQDWRPMILTALRTRLRIGELVALRWVDVDLRAGGVTVRQSTFKGLVNTPKNVRHRSIDLSPDVTTALQTVRHLKGPLVFCRGDGRAFT